MHTEARKAAIAAYKERKAAAGIFTITCPATGQRWVGSAPDLSTIRNRLWFTLRQGSHRCASLQAAWNAHGENLAFEPVERIEDEEIGPESMSYVRDRILKARRADWCARLQAESL